MDTTTTRRPRAARFKTGRTVREVGRCLAKILDRESRGGDPETRESLESFGASVLLALPGNAYSDSDRWEAVRNRFRWVEVSVVTGNSEGHYVHVRLACETGDERGNRLPDRKARPDHGVIVFTGKTFSGMAAAYRFAARLAVLLDA